MQPTKNYLLVRVDKQQQLAKREKTESGIYLPPEYVYMKHNLQYGEVIAIGAGVKKRFPQVEIGDLAIFHHMVESQERFLAETLPNGDEHRFVTDWPDTQTEHLFGVIKQKDGFQHKAGDLIPHPSWVFFHPDVKPHRKTIQSALHMVDADMWEDEDRLVARLADLEKEQKSLAESLASLNGEQHLRKIEEIEKALQAIQAERGRISAFLNSTQYAKMRCDYVHPETAKTAGLFPDSQKLVRKHTWYPIYFAGNEFKLIKASMLVGRFK